MASRPVIIITAANQGLGHEALKALAPANKYHLVAAARSQSKADKAVKVIASEIGSNPINFTPVDKFGHLDIMVNNATINRSPNDNATLRENLHAVFETTVFGVAVMNEPFLPLTRASAYPQRRIVTATSGLGMFGIALSENSPYNIWKYKFPVYRSSKSVVNMLAAVDKITLQDENIPTVLVEPGYCRTAFGGFSDHKDPGLGGKVIARSAVEGDNKYLLLKIVEDAGKHAEFGW